MEFSTKCWVRWHKYNLFELDLALWQRNAQKEANSKICLRLLFGPELARECGDTVKTYLEANCSGGEDTWHVVCGTGCNGKNSSRNKETHTKLMWLESAGCSVFWWQAGHIAIKFLRLSASLGDLWLACQSPPSSALHRPTWCEHSVIVHSHLPPARWRSLCIVSGEMVIFPPFLSPRQFGTLLEFWRGESIVFYSVQALF